MCGIGGLFRPAPTPGHDDLEAMNEELCHRGPDDEGYYLDGPVGLAHRRLSIIDPEAGRQPIANEDGSVVVAFNGEIYNYRDLRATLETRGHAFDTDTDTEVLVHAYEEYGLDFLRELSGMFAFALYDVASERLVLARDPMGIKPLYVAGIGGGEVGPDGMAFGSELPAVLASPVPHGGLDREALSRYFAFGFVPAPRTPFANVRAVRSGERLVVSEGGVDSAVFYDPTIPDRAPGIERAATELRSRVEGAVERRLMADVPLGAFLSGGIDSSVIVGTMAQLAEEPIDTFTVGFDQSLFDESGAAREVARFHGTNHHETIVTPDAVRDVIPEVLGKLGQPFADQSLLPTYVVARETSDHVTVALSGDGADELFAGYDKYLGEYYSRYYRAVPGPVRRSVVEPTLASLPASRGNRSGELVRKLRKFTRGGIPDIADRHAEWLRIADAATDRAFTPLDPAAAGRADLGVEHDAVATRFEGERDDLSRIMAVDTRYSLPNQMLRKVDLASMYNSLEVRVPFLDRDVVEYATSLPIGYKMTARDRKRVLKRAFEDVLPPAIRQRSKQGFDMPIGEWLKRDLADEFEARIGGLDSAVVDTREVMDVYAEHASGAAEHGKFLWAVYVYAVWADRMLERGILETV